MKSKVIQFIKDFILMAIIITIVVFIFYKTNVVSEFSFFNIIGFMIGWSIWQLIEIFRDSKRKKQSQD